MRSLRVLVVDDHADNAESWALLLRLFGHEVFTALDGNAAIAAAALRHPHVVFLDLSMPKLDGYGTAAHLIARQADRPTLIAVTARDGWEDRRRCQEAGFDYHFTKPADPVMVIELLSAIAIGLRP